MKPWLEANKDKSVKAAMVEVRIHQSRLILSRLMSFHTDRGTLERSARKSEPRKGGHHEKTQGGEGRRSQGKAK